MKAASIFDFGLPKVARYEEIPHPEAASVQSLVRVKAAGVGHETFGGVTHSPAESWCGLPRETCAGMHVPPPFSAKQKQTIGARNAKIAHYIIRVCFDETERGTKRGTWFAAAFWARMLTHF